VQHGDYDERIFVRRVAHPSLRLEGAPSFRVLCERVGLSTSSDPRRKKAL